MTLSLYQASVPVLSRSLKNLDGILEKAATHAEENGIDQSVLLSSRLYPDMFPLVRQVQIATDLALRGTNRLAGEEPVSTQDDETDIAALRSRIMHAVEVLDSYRPEQIDGNEARVIHLKLPSREMEFSGQSFLLGFVLPNVFFHITTAYDILRHNGVSLGKADYLGAG